MTEFFNKLESNTGLILFYTCIFLVIAMNVLLYLQRRHYEKMLLAMKTKLSEVFKAANSATQKAKELEKNDYKKLFDNQRERNKRLTIKNQKLYKEIQNLKKGIYE